MRSVAARHLPPLVAAIGFSLFQKIRFENDLIFFYGRQPIMDHFFIKIRKHELEQFERSLSSAALDRCGIDVAQDQVELLGILGIVPVFIEMASGIPAAAIACAWGPVPPAAPEWDKVRTIRGTVSVGRTFLISGALPRKSAFIFQKPMKPDFFSYGGLVLSNRICDSGL